jgi:hypothetical protein
MIYASGPNRPEGKPAGAGHMNFAELTEEAPSSSIIGHWCERSAWARNSPMTQAIQPDLGLRARPARHRKMARNCFFEQRRTTAFWLTWTIAGYRELERLRGEVGWPRPE